MLLFNAKLLDNTYFLTGAIDENSDLSVLLEAVPPVKINFKGIKKLNSIGIKNWIVMMNASKGKLMEFHECTPMVIDTANMIPSFLNLEKSGNSIQSIHVPHFCSNCNNSIHQLVSMNELKIDGDEVQLPKKHCQHCGGFLEEDIDQDFFFFLNPE